MPCHVTRSARRPLAWLLAGALLFAQALGLAHRVLHAETQGHANRHEVHAFADAVTQVSGHDGATLFGHDEGAPDCRLFDHMAAGDALAGAVDLAAFDAPTDRGEGRPTWPARAADEAVFSARAPPPIRA